MCTYIKKIAHSRYLALTASVEVRIGSSKTARNEQVCAHQEVNFPKSFGEVVYFWMDCSCAPMFWFVSVTSDGATRERQI